MIPFTPHLSFECLEKLNCKSINQWPDVKTDIIEEVKVAIQVNGKTRDIITINKDVDERDVNTIVNNKSKAKKYIENKKILKTIFVKNKIINYIISN